jgi:exopolysaccharide biosynthesis polyprenyl glycosylphosphotransferase
LIAAAAAEDARMRREAAQLATLAGAFSLFGLRIDPQEPASVPPLELAAPEARRRPPLPRIYKRGAYIPPRTPMAAVAALDWIIVALAAELAALWGAGASLLALPIGQALGFLAAALALKAGLWLTESYRVTPAELRPERGVGGLALGAIFGLIAVNFSAPDARSAGALAATLPFAAIVMAGLHAALAVWIRALHRKGAFSEAVVLVGATEAARRFATRCAKSGEARVIAIVDDRIQRASESLNGIPVTGDVAALLAWPDLPHADRIVIAVTSKAESRVRELIQRLRITPHRIDLLLDYDTQHVQGAERLNGVALACVSGRVHCRRRAFVKRTQDILVGAALAVLFALPMLAIALAIKCDSKGPVLYRQRRYGFNNRAFTLLKFRTLGIDVRGPTRVGALLRRYGLDELPQLLHVLKGEMSLVGPRPHAVGMRTGSRAPEAVIGEYAHRHRVKPGITGWAQVNGARGGAKTPAALRQRVRLDLDYVARASLWLDLQIITHTPAAMLRGARARR